MVGAAGDPLRYREVGGEAWGNGQAWARDGQILRYMDAQTDPTAQTCRDTERDIVRNAPYTHAHIHRCGCLLGLLSPIPREAGQPRCQVAGPNLPARQG